MISECLILLPEFLLKMSKTLAVIPARLDSSRFPNKPLKEILGIPMVAHCLYRAKFCKKIDLLILATPDKEIYELGKKLGFEVCITSHDHERATERAGEVVEILKGQKKYFGNVILLQGDEPQLNPKVVDQLIEKTKYSKNGIVNLIHKIKKSDLIDTNVVKALVNKKNEILYFSRAPIPKVSDNAYRQLGLIGFKTDLLLKFIDLKPTPHETIESIDMMRLLDNDIKIDSFEIDKPILGVDEKHHIQVVEKYLASDTYYLDYKNKYERL